MYDYIIAGGGLSGMCLAYLISKSGLRDKKVLVIDKKLKIPFNRDWSFWVDGDYPFKKIISGRWKKFKINFDDQEIICPLKRYQIHLIRSRDFFNFVYKSVKQSKNIDFLEGEVKKISQELSGAQVVVGDRSFHSKKIFTSIRHQQITNKKYHHLLMQGYGWEVTIGDPVFDPQILTLFDFRTFAKNQLEFFYVMPLSNKKALISYAAFTKADQTVSSRDATTALDYYLKKILNVTTYKSKSTGYGSIPLSDQPVQNIQERDIISIGASAGLIKPTTSYGFTKILADTQKIVDQLKGGRILKRGSRNFFYKSLDSSFLELLENHPKIVKGIFRDLFIQARDWDELFDFLDEKNNLYENLRLLRVISPVPFLKTFLGVFN